MLFAHFFDGPSGRLLRCVEPGVEIETVFFLDVKADERRIGNDQAAVIDVRQLAFWCLAIAAAIFAINKTSELQVQHGIDNERNAIGKPEVRPKRVERDHGSGLSHLMPRRRFINAW
jgi:hypothetical protein